MIVIDAVIYFDNLLLHIDSQKLTLHFEVYKCISSKLTKISILRPPACCHFFVVGGIEYQMTRIAVLAGVYTLGRATQARQVEG